MRIKRKMIRDFIASIAKDATKERTTEGIVDFYIKKIKQTSMQDLKSLRDSNGLNAYIEDTGVHVGPKKFWQIPSLVMMFVGGDDSFSRMSTQIGERLYMGSGYYDILKRKTYQGQDITHLGLVNNYIANSKLAHELSHHVISTKFSNNKSLSKVLHGGLYALDIVAEKIFDGFIQKQLKKIEPDSNKRRELTNEILRRLEIFRVVVECFCYYNEFLYLENAAKKLNVEHECEFVKELAATRVQRAVSTLSRKDNAYMVNALTPDEVDGIMGEVILAFG